MNDRPSSVPLADSAGRPRQRRVVVGITGASGAAYAQKLCTTLVRLGHEVHIVITNYGKRLLHDELGMEGVQLDLLCGLPAGITSEEARSHGVVLHPAKDVGASLGSGSFRHDGMIILPCSSNTLGQIASGAGDQLLTRAAAVAMKERFPLVICHREAPLNRVDLKNMLELHDAGAIICPTNPGFYLHPKSVEDIVDFVVARVLDQIGIEHDVSRRWDQQLADEQVRRLGAVE
jgi:flavin prenyltransferase